MRRLRARRHGLALVAHLAGEVAAADGHRLHAGGHALEQRGLAGAVLADHGVDLAGAHAQVHVRQRRHAVKALGDAAHFEDRVVHLVSL